MERSLIIYPRREFELALIDPKIDKIWKSLGKSSKVEPPCSLEIYCSTPKPKTTKDNPRACNQTKAVVPLYEEIKVSKNLRLLIS